MIMSHVECFVQVAGWLCAIVTQIFLDNSVLDDNWKHDCQIGHNSHVMWRVMMRLVFKCQRWLSHWILYKDVCYSLLQLNILQYVKQIPTEIVYDNVYVEYMHWMHLISLPAIRKVTHFIGTMLYGEIAGHIQNNQLKMQIKSTFCCV